jgi:hypothetical protein
MTIGFNRDITEKEENIFERYIGKPGMYEVNGFAVEGVLKEINFEKGYLIVQPSIVRSGINKLRLEKRLPTILGIPSGKSILIRPLQKGDLEKYVKDYNGGKSGMEKPIKRQ